MVLKVRTADVEDVDLLLLGQFDELHAVRRLKLAGNARRLAAGVRLEFVELAIREHAAGPRKDRHLIERLDGNAGNPRTGSQTPLSDGVAPCSSTTGGRSRRRPRRSAAATGPLLLRDNAADDLPVLILCDQRRRRGTATNPIAAERAAIKPGFICSDACSPASSSRTCSPSPCRRRPASAWRRP